MRYPLLQSLPLEVPDHLDEALRELIGHTDRFIRDPKPVEIGRLFFGKLLRPAQEKRHDVPGAWSPCSSIAGGAASPGRIGGRQPICSPELGDQASHVGLAVGVASLSNLSEELLAVAAAFLPAFKYVGYPRIEDTASAAMLAKLWRFGEILVAVDRGSTCTELAGDASNVGARFVQPADLLPPLKLVRSASGRPAAGGRSQAVVGRV